MSNILDQEEEPFNDKSDELNGGTQDIQDWPATPSEPRRVFNKNLVAPTYTAEKEQEEICEQEEDIDISVILTDARLRLEQGRLYEMVMKHELFNDIDSDERAIKIVQKEIRKFAQERMEIMLGMRQEQSKIESTAFSLESFPFNSLEVDVLKALAATATQGASREAEPFHGPSQPPKTQFLNPIGKNSNKTTPVKTNKSLNQKPTTPVKRTKVDSTIQRILEEEGVTIEEINHTFNREPLSKKDFEEMSAEELVERNKRLKTTKQVPSANALPMPSPEHIEAMYQSRANQAAANPQMQMIMNLLEKRKPTT